MRLLYLNKIVTNKGWGAECFLNEALRARGIQTICIDYEQNRYRLSEALANIDQNFQAVLIQRGIGYNFPLSVLKGIRRPKVLLFTELVKRNPQQYYLFSSGVFDHLFVRSSGCREFVLNKGWFKPENVSIFLSSFSPKIHRRLAGVEKDIDVLFIGSLTKRRKRILAEMGKSIDLSIKYAFAEEMVNYVNRAKIVLNIHGEKFLDTETRVFEVLACNGFLITEKLSSESPFISGIHLVEGANLSEMMDRIRYYLNRPEERANISNCGFQFLQEQHSYKHRAKTLSTSLNTLVGQAEIPPMAFNQSVLNRARFEESLFRLSNAAYWQLIKWYGQFKASRV